MESVVSKIQETGQHAAKKTDALFGRTRDAGAAFVDEVAGAGRDLVAFVRSEGKGWKRFLSTRTTQLQSEVRDLLTVPAIEREVLTRVDGTLRAIDAKIRARLVELDKHEQKPAARRRGATNGKRTPVGRKAKSAAGTAKAPAAGATVTASVRH